MSNEENAETTMQKTEECAGGAGADKAPAPVLTVRGDKSDRFTEYMILMMKVGLLPSVLLFASALLLAAMGLWISGAALAVAAAAALLIVWMLSALSRSRLGISPARLRVYELSAFSGTPATNGMLVPSLFRRLPLTLGFLTSVAAAVTGVVMKFTASEVVSGALSALCSTVTLGIGATAAMAMTGGVVRLEQSGIRVDDPCKIGTIARANILLADKSVFRIESGAELKGFFFCGDNVRLSDLSIRRHFPMVLGFTLCDNGSLSREYGFFRENISDALLRIMHTSPPEYEMLHRYTKSAAPDFDRERGFATGGAMTPGGNVKYAAGRPEKLLPLIMNIYTSEGVRSLTEGDRGLLKVTLRNAYQNGFSVIALTAGEPDNGMTFIAFAFLSTELVPDADLSVAELEKNGVRVIEASDENENAAFHEANLAGVAFNMGQVLSRDRIDRFSATGVGRAIGMFKVAAEVDSPRRAVLVRLLKGRKKLVISASRDVHDGLFPDADISVGSSAEALSDVHIKSCRVSDVAELIRITRSVCTRSHKSAAFLLCVNLCAVFCAALSLAFTGRVPFEPQTVVLLTLLLPVFQASACASGGAVKNETNYKIAPSARMRARGIGRLPDRSFAAALIIYAFYAGLISAAMFDKYGAGHAFLTLAFLMLTSGLICRVWGRSLLTGQSYGGRGFLLLTLLSALLVVLPIAVPGLAGFFALAGFSYVNLPAAVIPSIIPIVLYEICRLAIAAAHSRAESAYGKRV